MSRFRSQVYKLTSDELPNSLDTWIKLLNFFDSHKSDLDMTELNKIVDKCENIRLCWNETHSDIINKKDVNPNIYQYVSSLKNILFIDTE